MILIRLCQKGLLSLLMSISFAGISLRASAQTLVPATDDSNAKILGLEIQDGYGNLVTLDAEFIFRADPELNSFNGVFGEGIPPSIEGLPFFNNDPVGVRNSAAAILDLVSSSNIEPHILFGFPPELARAPYLLGGFEGGGGDLYKLFFPLNVSADHFDLLQGFVAFDGSSIEYAEILFLPDSGVDITTNHRDQSWCNTCLAFLVGEGVELWVILREVEQ